MKCVGEKPVGGAGSELALPELPAADDPHGMPRDRLFHRRPRLLVVVFNVDDERVRVLAIATLDADAAHSGRAH